MHCGKLEEQRLELPAVAWSGMMGCMWEGNGGMRGGHPLHLAGRGDQTQLETWSLSGPLWPSGRLLGKSPRQTQALATGTTSVPALPAQGSTVLRSETCATASQGWEVCQVQTMSPLPCPVSPMPWPMPPPPGSRPYSSSVPWLVCPPFLRLLWRGH